MILNIDGRNMYWGERLLIDEEDLLIDKEVLIGEEDLRRMMMYGGY